METKKDTMKTLAQRAKKRKGIIAASLVLVVAVGSVMVVTSQASAASGGTMVQAQETGEVTIRSLVRSVGATGTIVSVRSKDLTVSLTNVDIEEVLVSEGDLIAAGDILMTFDISDIEDNLDSAQKNLSTAQQRNSISAQEAARTVSDAQRTESYQTGNAQTKVDTSYSDYKNAGDNYYDALDKLDDLKKSESNAYNTYIEKRDAMNAAKDALNSSTVSDNDGMPADKQAAYEAAVAAYQSAEADYNSIKASRQQQETTVDSLCTLYNNAAASYNTATRDYDNTVAAQSSSVAGARNSQKTTGLNANTDNEKKQVEQYEQQIEEGILTAPFAGTVTAVNYEAGDSYNGGVVMTIQDCSTYEIEAEIGEYDISNIKLGQQVLIKTNATGQTELQGKVLFISPTATKTATGISSDVTYKVRIALSTPNERLKLDMSASLSIIIESHENAYTVPYNAVETDEDGNYFITEVEADGITTKKVPVSVIMESNYYTEIQSQDIYEGQKVLIKETDDNTSEDASFSMMGGGF